MESAILGLITWIGVFAALWNAVTWAPQGQQQETLASADVCMVNPDLIDQPLSDLA